MWEKQLNQFGKQPKRHDLQRLQCGKSKIDKPQNIGEEVPNFWPLSPTDLLMRNPWHWSRNFIHYNILKMCILHFSLIHVYNIYDPLDLAQHRNHFLVISAYRLSFLHPFKVQWYIWVRSHISFKSTGLIIFYDIIWIYCKELPSWIFLLDIFLLQVNMSCREL